MRWFAAAIYIVFFSLSSIKVLWWFCLCVCVTVIVTLTLCMMDNNSVSH